MKKLIRSYEELMDLESFEDRFSYLKLDGIPTASTFGGYRYLNQVLYNSPEWKRTRNKIIYRDCGCDLGVRDRLLGKRVVVHHINPLTPEQLINHAPSIFDENNLITCSYDTHNAIHYGDYSLVRLEPTIRRPNDTCPWR